jgi:2-polyprenyl-6-hydroxyphenyl methylase / 3-demethylubiquinone-9 3-methyltransferase
MSASGRYTDDELRAIYDQRYVDQYDPHAVQRMRRMLPLLDLSPGDVVADFGCGNGVLLELIAPRVGEYIGVDFSDEFVRAAERRRDAAGVRNGTFHCGDLIAFCEANPNRFDAAFALDFSEHVYDDQFLRIFRAIHGSLKPGAPLYIHTPNAEYFMERLKERGTLTQVEGHVGVRDAERHRVLLAACGFADVRVRYLAHYLYVASLFHWLGALPLVGSLFRARLFLTCVKSGDPALAAPAPLDT